CVRDRDYLYYGMDDW
nr:immunoglobulin heavy chain junction region [Mus musculus]